MLVLLRNLLSDPHANTGHTAAMALGRLANSNDAIAREVVKADILPQLVYSLAEQGRAYKKAAAFVLRAVAKHDAEMAKVHNTHTKHEPACTLSPRWGARQPRVVPFVPDVLIGRAQSPVWV